VTGALDRDWAVVSFAGQPYRFLLGAPIMELEGRATPLVGGAYLLDDTLFVPLQWLAEFVPRRFAEGYRYDPLAGRFEEARLAPTVTRTVAATNAPSGLRVRPPSAKARAAGFRMQHKVTIDAGHGGPDGGNPGLFFPKGIQEKHVTLAIARAVRTALDRRGVEVVMTRDRDTLIALAQRAPRFCREDCELFVSIHVNSLERRTGYQNVNGVETYFVGAAVTAEARRVAAMENEALRYETGYLSERQNDPLEFILKDLQVNEYLRESAQAADFVQRRAAAVHPGQNRGAAQNPLLAVLRTATRPAILVEVGFATNRRDAQFMASTEGQGKLAEAIAEGIVDYLLQYERKILGVAAP
jgi:N-acetylmuramoyl-L-alanine amidase